jgi:hypothetical protein
MKPEVLAHLRESENAVSLGRKYSSIKEWRDEIRWAVAFVAISALIAGVIGVIPWSKLPSLRGKKTNTIQIVEIPRGSDQQLEAVQEHQEGDLADVQGSGDEEIEDNDDMPAKAAVISAAPKVAVVAKNDKSSDETSDESESDTPDTHVAPASTPAKSISRAAGQGDEDTPTTVASKAKGFVYRAFMTLPNLDELGPKITDNITDLGGEKAGEVELGWKRGEGRYYHFSLPEESEEKLLEKLRAYGPVRISKDPHPRVMPKGKVRFILWVEPSH